MKSNFGDVKNLGNLTKINWSEIEQVDILSAGYPCQPFSQAGQRKGTNDPRHLWPYIFEAISTIRPSYVILENVRGHLSLGFKEVLKDLAQIGYAAEWEIVRASDIGAPHQRARLFVIAYPESPRRGTQQDRQGSSNSTPANGLGVIDKPDTSFITDSLRKGLQGAGWSRCECAGCSAELTTDANSNARSQPRRANRELRETSSEQFNRSNRQVAWGRYQTAITNWERLTRVSPDPITENRLNPEFVEWLMGLPKGWVTDVDISRTQQLKALGNGVVPQQAAYAIKKLLNAIQED